MSGQVIGFGLMLLVLILVSYIMVSVADGLRDKLPSIKLRMRLNAARLNSTRTEANKASESAGF